MLKLVARCFPQADRPLSIFLRSLLFLTQLIFLSVRPYTKTTNQLRETRHPSQARCEIETRCEARAPLQQPPRPWLWARRSCQQQHKRRTPPSTALRLLAACTRRSSVSLRLSPEGCRFSPVASIEADPNVVLPRGVSAQSVLPVLSGVFGIKKNTTLTFFCLQTTLPRCAQQCDRRVSPRPAFSCHVGGAFPLVVGPHSTSFTLPLHSDKTEANGNDFNIDGHPAWGSRWNITSNTDEPSAPFPIFPHLGELLKLTWRFHSAVDIVRCVSSLNGA